MSSTTTAADSGVSRLHTGLAVTDVEASTQFYTSLLGVSPSKRRAGYAKFEPRDPPANLSLIQVSGVLPHNPETHYGIEVTSREQLETTRERLAAAGMPFSIEENVACCYAVQDKIWLTDPDGNSWEVFLVLEAAAEVLSMSDDCCGSDCCTDHAVDVAS